MAKLDEYKKIYGTPSSKLDDYKKAYPEAAPYTPSPIKPEEPVKVNKSFLQKIDNLTARPEEGSKKSQTTLGQLPSAFVNTYTHYSPMILFLNKEPCSNQAYWPNRNTALKDLFRYYFALTISQAL